MPCEHRVSGGAIQAEVAKRTMAARGDCDLLSFSLSRRIGSCAERRIGAACDLSAQ
jgi:hypothetical protein